eukprot:m.546167 g.546167  ORF g.546167 m.546167 type:complete len:429 (+) comp57680_c0_seq1:106-1392(+)
MFADDDEDVPSAPPQATGDATTTAASSTTVSASADASAATTTTDLNITVDNPLKLGDGVMDAHVVYTIRTKTTREYFTSGDFYSQRRYSDFDWLHDTLAWQFPRQIIPPMPPKHSLKRLDKFDAGFLESRRIGLQRFLARIAQTPILSRAPTFVAFLQAKSHELQTYKKSNERSIFNKMSESVTNVTSRVTLSQNKFIPVRQKIDLFEKKIRKLHDQCQASLASQLEVSKSCGELGCGFGAMAEAETELESSLLAMKKAHDIQAAAAADFTTAFEDNIVLVLGEYSLYAEGIRGVLSRRDTAQSQAESLSESMVKQTKDLEAARAASDQKTTFNSLFGKDPAVAKQEKIAKLELQVANATKAANDADSEQEAFNADVQADMLRFEEQKTRDVKRAIVDYADAQLAYYTQMKTQWGAFIRELEALPVAE